MIQRKDNMRAKRVVIMVSFVLLLGVATLVASWYLSSYRSCVIYVEKCNAQLEWNNEIGVWEDTEGYRYQINKPVFLSWNWNLSISMPQTQGEACNADRLDIWPTESTSAIICAVFYEYSDNSAEFTQYQLFLDNDGMYIPYDDDEDYIYLAVFDSHEKNIDELRTKMKTVWFD